MSLAEKHRRLLVDTARAAIRHGLNEGRPLAISAAQHPAEVRPVRATFVTLERHGKLRGCIGTLEPRLPLIEDVALHAYEAAFEDPRFPPVTQDEFPGLDIHISILSPATPLPCSSEAELMASLKPGEDGLILVDGRRRSTFLPSVWNELKDAREFIAHLKLKAGLPSDYWSSTIRFHRYETEVVE
jgi:hypothetical protein